MDAVGLLGTTSHFYSSIDIDIDIDINVHMYICCWTFIPPVLIELVYTYTLAY